MSLSAEDWGRQLACRESNRAVAVFRTPDLVLTWCNLAYEQLLDEPYRSNGARGLRLQDYAPLEYITKGELLRSVGATGDPDLGEERTFSVEDGTTIFNWSAHPVCRGHVIAVIEVTRPTPSVTRSPKRSSPRGLAAVG